MFRYVHVGVGVVLVQRFSTRRAQIDTGHVRNFVYEASARSPVAWRAIIAGPNHQVFGLFDESQLIGMTGVCGGRERSNCKTAFLVMSFIVSEYRRRGLSSMLYAPP
jgi:hypothetical protein